jgi:hypothetical protein
MKRLIKYFSFGLLGMFLLTFPPALYDDAFERVYYTGVWYKDILGSLKYYVFWVLPYWWLVILIGSVALGGLFYGVNYGFKKNKNAE